METLNKVLARISESKGSGQRFTFRAGLEVVVLVSTGDGVLSIEPAEKIDLDEGVVAIETPKGRFFFDVQRIIGVSCKNTRDGGTGFKSQA